MLVLGGAGGWVCSWWRDCGRLAMCIPYTRYLQVWTSQDLSGDVGGSGCLEWLLDSSVLGRRWVIIGVGCQHVIGLYQGIFLRLYLRFCFSYARG